MTDAGGARGGTAEPKAPRVGVLAVVYLLVAGALYGLLFSINKIATTNGVPGLAYVFWHTLGAGLILWLGCLATRTPVGFDRAHLRLYFVAGAVGISIPVSVLAHVAPELPASLVVMVTCLSPTCTYLMAMTLRMERFRLLSTGGVALGFAGILILVVPGITLPSFAEVSWLLLALVAPVCFAAFNIAGAILWPPKANSLGLACGIQMGGAIVLLPVMLGTGETYLFPGPLLAGDLAILGATGVTALVWYLIFEVLRMGGPLFLSQFGYIIVLAGLGWGALIFGERLSSSAWIAAALLLAGLAVLTWSKRRARV
ncbi:MAG: DMT family transporter [Rhodospirillaceae bacterium]|nr:DMT family transporter [Rhodospirillaceae bacterium]